MKSPLMFHFLWSNTTRDCNWFFRSAVNFKFCSAGWSMNLYQATLTFDWSAKYMSVEGPIGSGYFQTPSPSLPGPNIAGEVYGLILEMSGEANAGTDRRVS